jgi:type I restriction enzyme S subunit
LKWAVSKIGSGKTPKGGGEVYSDSGVLFLRSQNVHFTGLRLDDVAYIDEATDTEMSSTRVLGGDVLLNITGASLGRCCVVPEGTPSANVNQHVCILRPRPARVLADFLNACIASPSVQSQVFSSENGVSREGLNYTQTANLAFATPPDLNEQRAIAAFLDRETARIDALIGHKERLISLLEEKRQAVISHAVTRGLNAAVPLKDSGLNGFDSVPSHWTITRLKYTTPNVTVGVVVTPSKYYVDEGVPALRGVNVREGRIEEDELVYFSPESNQLLAKSMLRTGDLVAVRTGQPGTTAVVSDQYNNANCIDLILIRRSPRFNSHFLCYLANSRVAKAQYEEGAEGAIQQHLNIETAKNMTVLLPPLNEQAQIVRYLDQRTADLTQLMSSVNDGIARLQEYRAALISAAVTGLIDVRGEVTT